ncbi:MAG: thermonuclease family protein [Desulfurococcaceae archaeon]
MIVRTRSLRNPSKHLLKAIYIVLVLHILLSPVYISKEFLPSVEIDVCGNIYRVIDGDTLDVFPVGRVRLADVNASELGIVNGETAKQALLNLVQKHGPKVYLDVDDLHVIDKYNRVVAIVYLKYNETHILNVNKWLIDNGYVTISDYPNEFDPNMWTLYTYLPSDPCVEKTIITTTTVTITVTTGVVQTPVDMLTQVVVMFTIIVVIMAMSMLICITRKKR